MKEKILAALKIKFKNLGFGDKAFDGVAAYLSQTVTEESAIETAIDGVEPLLKSFQGDADKRVNDAVAKVKIEKEPGKGGEPGPANEPKKEGDEVPAWAQKLIDSNEKLSNEVNTLKSGKTFDNRKQALELKLKDAPVKFKEITMKNFGRMNFDKDEDFNEFLTETETDLAAFKQDLADQGLGGSKPPVMGKPNKDGISSGVQAYIDSKTGKGSEDLGGKQV